MQPLLGIVLVAGSAWAGEPFGDTGEVAGDVPDAPAPAVAPPAVEVLAAPQGLTTVESGARPRPLALRVRPGRYDVQVRRAASVAVEGEEEAGEAPEAITELRAEVDDAARLTVRTADLLGASVLLLASLDQELRAMPELRVVLPLDATQTAPIEIHGLRPEATDSLRELIADLGWSLGLVRVPLPGEPVGAGARWTWTRATTVERVAVDETWEATLVQRRGPRVRVDVRGAARAPAGATVDGIVVEDLGLTVEGAVWLDLRRPVPEAADLDVKGGLTLSWVEADGPRRITGSLDGGVVVVSRPADGDGPG